MTEIFSTMEVIAEDDSATARPLSSASLAPLTAICSLLRLFSAFWVMDALICSRLAVVSCTEAACSLVPWESVCEEAETWAEAPERALSDGANALRLAELAGLLRRLRAVDQLVKSSRESD